MIELFVKRPATTVMFVLFFVVMGIVSYFNLSVEKTPKIDLPIVTVKTVFPGATPEEVETQVVKKIEDSIAEISGIKKLKAYSYENFGLITIEFKLGNDVNVKSIEVKDKVESLLNDLPDGADKPLVEKFDPFAVAVMDLVLSSETLDGKDLYEYADKKLKNKLTAIEGIATVDIYGGKERQIKVDLDPMLMNKYYISITDVIKAVKSRNMNVPGGLIDKRETSFNVRFIGEFMDLEEIRSMTLVSKDGTELKMSDIAIVTDGSKKAETVARYNGKEAVVLSLKKISDGNAIKISKAVNQNFTSILKSLPKGMSLEVASDTTEFIVTDTNSTLESILIGVLLTIIVLYVFTGNLRLTFIASVVIPTSIISSVFLMDSMNFTINMMTLLAIATSLGTLIANAIVIVENVLTHLDRGKDPKTAAIDGTKEVAVAVLASAGTNLVVFTPIAFMAGTVGQFMKEFGLTVVFATIFSLIASFSLTPMLCGVFLKPRSKDLNNENKKSKFRNPITLITNKTVSFLLKEYRVIFDVMFKFPKTVLIILLIVFISSFKLFKYVGGEFVPTSDENAVTIELTLPQGSRIERTVEVSKEVEKAVKGYPEVKSVLTLIGDNGVQNSKVKMSLVKSENRKNSDVDLINLITPLIANIPGAEVSISRGAPVGGNQGDVAINIYGENYEDMINNSYKMIQIMKKSGYFRSISSSYKTPKEELRFIPDQKKITSYGLPNVAVAQTIRASIYGDDSNVYKEKGEDYKINISLDDRFKNKEEDINQIFMISKKGILPITELGRLENAKSMPTITRRDKERIIQIKSFLSKSTAGTVQKELMEKFKTIKFKQNDGYRYVGNAENQDESSREILKASIIAIILTYMILAAIMNSYIYPFVIASSVFTSISGVIVMLFFMEHSVNIASMLAIVMLIGLVVNNAILMLDHTLQKLNEGKELLDAIWIGISEKFKAILMTSIAIIFATLPQLESLSLAKASMGTVLIGGMLASIIFTFLLVPILFWYAERIKRFFLK